VSTAGAGEPVRTRTSREIDRLRVVAEAGARTGRDAQGGQGDGIPEACELLDVDRERATLRGADSKAGRAGRQREVRNQRAVVAGQREVLVGVIAEVRNAVGVDVGGRDADRGVARHRL
jgi:hypothetical protein